MSEEIQVQETRRRVPPPSLEMDAGHFRFRMHDLDGAVHEKLVSAGAVREAFTSVPINSGWLPPEVRSWGTGRNGDWAVMFMAPARHTIEIMPDIPVEGRIVDVITTPLPGLVLFGIKSKYWMWSVKTEGLDPYREIYRAPLPNVEPDASLCFGTHQPPRCTATSIKQAWDVFMKSPFNNHRCDGKSKRSPQDVRVVLRDMARAPLPAHYPVEDLERQIPMKGITLDAAIRELLETGVMPG